MRTATKLSIAGGIIAILALLILVPWPPYYYQDRIRAQVVDGKTGEPISGAAVVAVWELAKGGWEETYHTCRYEETVTDAHGMFTLAAWKRWRKRGEGRFKDEDPILYIYKPGYKSVRLTNRNAYVAVVGLTEKLGQTQWTPVRPPGARQVAEKYPGWRWGGAKRYCYWNGQAIGMQPDRSLMDAIEALTIASYLGGDFRPEQLPTFWQIWRGGRARLPESARDQIPAY